MSRLFSSSCLFFVVVPSSLVFSTVLSPYNGLRRNGSPLYDGSRLRTIMASSILFLEANHLNFQDDLGMKNNHPSLLMLVTFIPHSHIFIHIFVYEKNARKVTLSQGSSQHKWLFLLISHVLCYVLWILGRPYRQILNWLSLISESSPAPQSSQAPISSDRE